jgi:hypothetical protein
VTFHCYIKAGKLSRTPEGLVDTTELLRIGLVLHPDTVLQPVTVQHEVTPPTPPAVTSPDTDTLQQLITVLQRELEAAHACEHAARERETLLLQMLQQVQQQSQRLLDVPRLPQTPTGPAVHSTPDSAKGDMRRRIVTLLHEYPEGLSPAQTRQRLGIEKDLGPTMKGMVRDGVIHRLEIGRYVVRD